jgi:N-methylhydantoinase B
MDVLNGILAQAVPDFIRAAGCGIVVPVVLGGPENEEGNRQVLVVQLLTGGTGAMSGSDGIDGRDPGTSGMANNPVESVESAAPVKILRYGLRIDSGGAGKWRGGVGLELTFTCKVAGCQILARGMERHRFVPWGMAGGLSGAGSRTIKNWGRPDEVELGKIDVIDLEVGETITVLTPGGGGYGDPSEREPELVLADVKRGFLSREAASQLYGVVLSDECDSVDIAATEKHRDASRRAAVRQDESVRFDFGAERTSWETVVDARLMTRINSALSSVSPSARMVLRRKLFAEMNRTLQKAEPLDVARLSSAVGPLKATLLEIEAR